MSFPQRVLIAMMYLPPYLAGGSLVYLNTIMTHLPQGLVEVLTCSTGDHIAEQAADQARPYRINRLPIHFSYTIPHGKIHSLKLMWTWLRALWQHVRPSAGDVVVVENIYYIGMAARLVCWRRRVPYIVTCFGEELATVLAQPNSWNGYMHRLIYRWTLQGAEAVISISAATTDLITQFGVHKNRIAFIPPPTQAPERWPCKQNILQFMAAYDLSGKQIVVSVGRLIRRKGHDHLLHAMPQVLRKCPNTVVVIASSGPLEDELRALAGQLNLEENARFLGNVDRNTLNILYAICNVFVMPNRTLPNGDQEGYGIVFNEANSFGKPAIGGKSGGTPEAILHEETGLLVNGERIDEIATAIIRLLTNTAFAETLGKRAQQWVLSERNPQQAADKFLSLVQVLGKTL